MKQFPIEKGKVNPIRHRCLMTEGRIGFIAFLDTSDIIVIAGVFYISMQISDQFTSSLFGFFFIVFSTAIAYVVNFKVKRILMPYPRFIEHFLNWWFSGADRYLPCAEKDPVPLVITRDVQDSQRIEALVREMKIQPTKRKKHV